ncbi:hypothetical protein [Undibacterium terreum]|uniref:Haem-binding uptake Tiki superfamily ChaN domain-containing protein n=1 Tax=Undibacterium terreum TaxID=1224302 RepID=A0A916U9H0_9BURK|nr:hypothetical protein [Undibacterium terreum]GGC64349.1 hypothetical protein GCM10011396_09140 [Undibacterium terreum]
MKNNQRSIFSWVKLPLLAATLVLGAQVASAKDLPCTPQNQIALADITSRIIVVGELHGTNEIPAFFSGLACSLLREGKPLIVGLEVSTSLQENLNAYMDSDGGEAARKRLAESRFGKLEDSKGSLAMLKVLESLRNLRQAGATVAVTGFGLSYEAMLAPLSKEERMWPGEFELGSARNIETRARVYKKHTLLILTGLLHAGRIKGLPWDPEHEPMGYILQQRLPFYSIAFAFPPGGSFWGCKRAPGSGDVPQLTDKLVCGAYETLGQGKIDDGDTNKWIMLDRITASPPMGL